MPGPIVNASKVPDPRIADLIEAGEVRVGMHSFMYTMDPHTGELNGALSGVILLDIARALGAQIGVEIFPVGYPTIPEMMNCVVVGRAISDLWAPTHLGLE